MTRSSGSAEPPAAPEAQGICAGCTLFAGGACLLLQEHLRETRGIAPDACTEFTPPVPAEETPS